MKLTVTDVDGDTNSSRKSFAVAAATTTVPPGTGTGTGTGSTPPPTSENKAAHAIWVAPVNPRPGQRVTLNGNASQGDAPLTCTWTSENQSGSRVYQTKGGCRATFVLQASGVRYFKLTVRDADGSTDSLRRAIRVVSARATARALGISSHEIRAHKLAVRIFP